MTEATIEESNNEEVRLLEALRRTPELLQRLRSLEGSELARQKALRDEFPDELVRAAMSLHEARTKAAGLLPRAEELWLTRVGLEQSTSWEVARHKARRFPAGSTVSDLCCGIGVDASAIAATCRVDAFDLNPAMVLRTLWNAELWNVRDNLHASVADVAAVEWTGKLVHADPDRRGQQDRPTKRLELYQPGLEWMQQLIQTASGGAIKISPASNFQQKFPGAEIELISLHGECREATVWFGCLAGTDTFRATVLPTGETISADPLSAWTNVAAQPGTFLFDPDPSLVRSGLVDVFAEQQNLQRLDREEEYLTGDAVPSSAFVTAFEVEAVLPNSSKELRRHLRDKPSRYYEVKCRHIPTNADTLRRQLPTGDAEPRVIIVCRISGRSHLVVARRVA